MIRFTLPLLGVLAVGPFAFGGEPAPAPAPAPTEPTITGVMHVGYNSLYEFRGLDMGDDMVEAGVDISGTYKGFGFSAGVWYASTNEDTDAIFGTFNELDVYGGVSKTWDKFTLKAGLIHYCYWDAEPYPTTTEWYVGGAYVLPWEITASFTYNYDFDGWKAGFYDANLAKTFKVSDCVSIETTIGANYSDGYNTDVDTGSSLYGMNNYYAKVAVPWVIKEGITLSPYAKVTIADEDLQTHPINAVNQDHFFGGAMLNIAF